MNNYQEEDWNEPLEVSSGYFFSFMAKGDSVQGTFLGHGENQHGQFYQFEHEGLRFAIGSYTDLVQKMEKVSPGNRLRIEFLGEEKSKNGYMFKRFRVQVARNNK